MLQDYSSKRWNACVINAVHCGICAVDALCINQLGRRHSGTQHGEASRLMEGLNFDDKELKDKIKQYSALIAIKALAEYRDQLMDKKDADKAKKNCERLYLWVKKTLNE